MLFPSPVANSNGLQNETEQSAVALTKHRERERERGREGRERRGAKRGRGGVVEGMSRSYYNVGDVYHLSLIHI